MAYGLTGGPPSGLRGVVWNPRLTYLGRPLKVEAYRRATMLKKGWWGAGYKLAETTNP
jgi:hypothetical protein